MFATKARHQPDYVFMALAAAWLLIGLVVLTSASGPTAIQKFQDAYYYVRHQLLVGILPGLVAFAVTASVDYRTWRRWATPFFALAVVLLLLVFVPGLAASWGTSKSWLNFGGFSFQPVEVAKIALIVFLAKWFDERGDARDADGGLLPFLAAFGLIAVLLLLQPDVGSLLVVGTAATAVYFLAGAPWRHMAGLIGLAGVALFALVKTSSYRASRLMTFLHPELDPQGIGYHINQAYLAIGSGGLFGLGLMHSRQKQLFLPEAVGDSVFAVLAEEFGFIMTVAVLAIIVAFLWRGWQVAQAAPDRFGRLLVGGIVAWICAQAAFNIASMVGLMPITGLPLPFMSYGGTSTVALLAAIGIMVNVSAHERH
ncbi:MAG: putative peptidoglycan glycosyltransferase FtsW [Patescibacteria group bacterium]|nr:putative peptidoglycan glycosyltransferase FtsW [Patescibacteria group bacterium]